MREASLVARVGIQGPPTAPRSYPSALLFPNTFVIALGLGCFEYDRRNMVVDWDDSG
jgi:hypothetical protein